MIEARAAVPVPPDHRLPDAYALPMKIVTIRDFGTRPSHVRDALNRDREAVLTANGRPVAVMIPVDAGSIDRAFKR